MKAYTDLDKLTDSVLMCKAYRSHAWEKLTNYDLATPLADRAWAIWASSCTRCQRQRFIYIDRKGQRMGVPYYRDPIDYPKTHRLATDDIHRELISRSLLVDLMDRRRKNGK